MVSVIILSGCERSKPVLNLQEFLAAPKCGDILDQLAEKPDHLEFVDCNPDNHTQIIFEARYRVSGKYAAQTEDFFNKKYGMNKLSYICCGWEPKDGKLGDFKKPETVSLHTIYFNISMYSDETDIQERTEWHKIPYFNVEAKILDI
jgi:hypothetical protein